MTATPSARSVWLFWVFLILVIGAGLAGWFFLRPGAWVDSSAALTANDEGIGLMEQLRYAEAVEAFERVTTLAPNWLPGQINLGIALLNLASEENKEDNLNRAVALFQQVLKKDPQSPRTLLSGDDLVLRGQSGRGLSGVSGRDGRRSPRRLFLDALWSDSPGWARLPGLQGMFREGTATGSRSERGPAQPGAPSLPARRGTHSEAAGRVQGPRGGSLGNRGGQAGVHRDGALRGGHRPAATGSGPGTRPSPSHRADPRLPGDPGRRDTLGGKGRSGRRHPRRTAPGRPGSLRSHPRLARLRSGWSARSVSAGRRRPRQGNGQGRQQGGKEKGQERQHQGAGPRPAAAQRRRWSLDRRDRLGGSGRTSAQPGVLRPRFRQRWLARPADLRGRLSETVPQHRPGDFRGCDRQGRSESVDGSLSRLCCRGPGPGRRSGPGFHTVGGHGRGGTPAYAGESSRSRGRQGVGPGRLPQRRRSAACSQGREACAACRSTSSKRKNGKLRSCMGPRSAWR